MCLIVTLTFGTGTLLHYTKYIKACLFSLICIPMGHHALKKTKLRLESYDRNPTARCPMRDRLRRLQHKHAKRCIPVDRLARTRTHRRISLDTKSAVYAIHSRTRGDRIYIGITYGSAWYRFKEHLKAARRYLNIPPEARDRGNSAHALYRVWGKYGIQDSPLKPLLVLGKPTDFAGQEEFHAQMDYYEDYFIDVAKSLAPRDYNVHNTNEAKAAP